MIVVGIDPGTSTGFAVWDARRLKLLELNTFPIHLAMQWIHDVKCGNGEHPEISLIIVEDARKRGWFGKMDEQQRKYGAAVREGAGAAKRDAAIWDDFLSDTRVAYQMRAPTAGATKWNSAVFKSATKWQLRTNEHERDAALLVYGMNVSMVQAAVVGFQQRNQKRA